MKKSLTTRLRVIVTLWLLLVPMLSQAVDVPFPGASWERLQSPEKLGWSMDKLKAARDYAATINTDAVMIVVNGQVLDEWGETQKRLVVHSVRKSFLSALFGIAVNEGNIRLTTTLAELGIDDNAPALTALEKTAKISDLLKARSGIYHPAHAETPAMAASRPLRGSHAPGEFWYYNNWDFNTLGTIFERQTKTHIFNAFKERIADPIGMQDFRVSDGQYQTGNISIHPAYHFRMTARDMARFGLLFLRNGAWRGRQIIPREWVKESTTSYSPAGYGYMWWVSVNSHHLPGVRMPDGTYSARGVGGQYILVVPALDLVIVHRVNTDIPSRAVTSEQFGELVRLILAARTTEAKVPVGASLPTGQQGQFAGSAQNAVTPIVPPGHAVNNEAALQSIAKPGAVWRLEPIDVIILGDGYLPNERSNFVADVAKWYAEFRQVTPYRELAGAFRVRGYWTPSSSRIGPERQSYYQMSAKTTTYVGTDHVKRSGFIMENQTGAETSRRISSLLTAIKASEHCDFIRGGQPSAVLVMLVKADEQGTVVSGFTTSVQTPCGGLRMAVAAALIHEFSHAFANLGDEYIIQPEASAGMEARQTMLKNANNLWSKSNYSFSVETTELPWSHLAPGSSLNPDTNSVIGLCWLGGGQEHGVWHSEPFCLMNGSHSNWDLAHLSRGAHLRSPYFCFWCEELVTARIAALTGLMGTDSSGTNLWLKWLELRPRYQEAFKVKARISTRNDDYAKRDLGRSPLIEKSVKR